VEIYCARCLEPVAQEAGEAFDLLYRPQGVDARGDEVSISRAETEIGYYKGEGLLLEDVIKEQLLLALPLNRPRVLAVADWLRVAMLGIAAFLLIPFYSGYGAAAARLLSRVVGAAYTGFALRRAIHSAPTEGAPEDELAAVSIQT